MYVFKKNVCHVEKGSIQIYYPQEALLFLFKYRQQLHRFPLNEKFYLYLVSVTGIVSFSHKRKKKTKNINSPSHLGISDEN